uniref:Uncharacterized protein n=1 Tax=Anguilla anguilla TaxID=7936 RepID=A0A0E9XHK5_ANGAN
MTFYFLNLSIKTCSLIVSHDKQKRHREHKANGRFFVHCAFLIFLLTAVLKKNSLVMSVDTWISCRL